MFSNLNEELPRPIQNKIMQDNDNDSYEPMPNSYHITELVGCTRKTYYRKILPKKPINIETAKNFYRGRKWDKDFCSCFRHNQIRVTYRCQKVPICISGHFDFLNQDKPNDPVITDLKSPKTLFYVKQDGKVSEHYRKQVLFYCYCAAIPKGAVMYWDGHQSVTFPIEVTDESCRNLVDELEMKSMSLYFALKNRQAPSKEVSKPEAWECRFCEFLTECETEKF